MKTINIKKAHRTVPDQPHESITILIEEEIEDPRPGELRQHDFETMLDERFGLEAHELFLALKSSLPGGTLDRLLVQMLADHASLLIVPHGVTRASQQVRVMREALGFAKSVIKCGEPWTTECEKVINGALNGTVSVDDLLSPSRSLSCLTCSNYLRAVPVPENFDAVFVCDFCEARRYKEIVLRSGLWRKVNFFPNQRGCMICGYNGEGFYQPSSHGCAAEAAELDEGGGLL